jgi:hypothetical protein
MSKHLPELSFPSILMSLDKLFLHRKPGPPYEIEISFSRRFDMAETQKYQYQQSRDGCSLTNISCKELANAPV